MKVAAILSLAVLLRSASAECRKFVCGPSTAEWASDSTCGMPDPADPSLYDIRSCPAGHTCPIRGFDSQSCEPRTLPAMYPGEPCDDRHPCRTGACTGGQCPGLELGAACTNVYDCGGIFTCSNNVCEVLMTDGNPCILASDCSQNYGCTGTDLSVNPPVPGSCTPYLSVFPQHSAPDCAANSTNLVANPYCISGYCYQSGGSHLCADVLASSSALPVDCSSASCTSKLDSSAGTAISGTCECSYSGHEYCNQFPGDPAYLSYIKYLAEFQSSREIKHCNTYRNHGSPISYMAHCHTLRHKLSDRQVVSYYRAIMYAKLVNAEDCVLEVLAPEYYEAVKAEGWWSWLFS